MDMREVREKDEAGLVTELLALRREAFNLRMQKGTGQLGSPSRFKAIRREIARIKTEMTARRNAAVRPE